LTHFSLDILIPNFIEIRSLVLENETRLDGWWARRSEHTFISWNELGRTIHLLKDALCLRVSRYVSAPTAARDVICVCIAGYMLLLWSNYFPV